MKFCPKCGSAVPDGTDTCAKCGTPLPDEPVKPAAVPRSASSPAHPWPRKERQQNSLFALMAAAGAVLIAAIVFVVLLGTHVICLSHDYAEPTCTEPATCRKCGRTTGEALGHDWTEATCSAPRTCTRCGAAEGDPLPHNWADATCTKPKTCTVCGASEGEPLGHDYVNGICSRCGAEARYASFGESGYSCLEVGTDGTPVSFSYQCGAADGTTEYASSVTVTAEDVTDMDLTAFGLSPGDCSLYLLTFSISYDEDHAGTGCYTPNAVLDYYDPELCAATAKELPNTVLDGDTLWCTSYDIEYNGTDMTVYVFSRTVNSAGSRILYRYICIPPGYDGFMIGLYSYANLGRGADITDNYYDLADEETVFLRLVP